MNTTQQWLVHFKLELNSETTAWVSIRTYHYDPPKPPAPLTNRRVLHQNAIDIVRNGETVLTTLQRSDPLITFVLVATGTAINGINCAAMHRFRLSKPDHDR